MTVAAFMELALHDPALGYYARAAQRSGRAGDFFTSVDVGPLFGELLEVQLAEMFQILQPSAFRLQTSDFALVEAGAGNGRLSADILRAARHRDPSFYSSARLHLVETSAAARSAQAAVLGDVSERLSTSGASLPASFEGVLIANELLDAFPVHQVVMRETGLREVYVAAGDHSHDNTKTRSEGVGLIEASPSTPALQEYLDRLGVALEPGWRVEISLRAVEWMRESARCLRRGFVILVDYGHEARELYSESHAHGTLTTFSRHQTDAGGSPAWLQRPGKQDITAHVDFTSIRNAAESEGLTTLAFLDQTYFLMGLLEGWNERALIDRSAALKTLVMPGGMGSTHKVMIFGKGVGNPKLKGCSFKMRVT